MKPLTVTPSRHGHKRRVRTVKCGGHAGGSGADLLAGGRAAGHGDREPHARAAQRQRPRTRHNVHRSTAALRKGEAAMAEEGNPMKELKIAKLVLNICVGESGDRLTRAAKVLEQLSGQQPLFSKGACRAPAFAAPPRRGQPDVPPRAPPSPPRPPPSRGPTRGPDRRSDQNIALMVYKDRVLQG